MNQAQNPASRATISAALASTVGAVVLLAMWPGTSSGQADRMTAPRSAQLDPAAQAVIADPENPATWRLPIETYMPTQVQVRLVTHTRDDLIDACMADVGYPDWKPAPDLPRLGGKTLTDWRYGIHDAELASRRGYHPAKAEQDAYNAAMAAGAVDKSGADKGALRTCAEQVSSDVPAAVIPERAQQISTAAYVESMRNPAVVAVFNNWSSCMKDKGYDYAAPMDANDDPRFNDPNEVTGAEIATAVADVECRDKHEVEKTWFRVESALQQDAIRRHQQELKKAQAAITSIVSKAKAAQ